MADAAVMSAQQLVVTDSAAARIAELAAREGQPGLMLRIAISGGGCSGFQYGFDLDDKANDDDRVFAHGDSRRSEEHTSELQSLMRISYAVFCLKKKNLITTTH